MTRPPAGFPHWLLTGGGAAVACAAVVAALAVTAALAGVGRGGAAPPRARPPSVAPTVPTIITSDLRFATTPTKGVWAELTLILDNPVANTPGGATRTELLVPGSLLEDYRIRSTEPNVVAQPELRADGRYTLAFPPPLPQTLNWYRLEMEVQRTRPRPIQVTLALDKPPFQTPVTGVRVIYADREADPFKVVPEPLVGWLPARAAAALPLLVAYTAAVGALVLAGCAVAFRAVRG